MKYDLVIFVSSVRSDTLFGLIWYFVPNTSLGEGKYETELC